MRFTAISRSNCRRRIYKSNHTLLHSRFTTERRKELERLVMDKLMPNKAERDLAPCIVVTTQIVEASLTLTPISCLQNRRRLIALCRGWGEYIAAMPGAGDCMHRKGQM